jgi:hypothetical protein
MAGTALPLVETVLPFPGVEVVRRRVAWAQTVAGNAGRDRPAGFAQKELFVDRPGCLAIMGAWVVMSKGQT